MPCGGVGSKLVDKCFFLVEWQSRQCFVVVCALYRVRTATASRGHAANQMQLEQTIWGQCRGQFFSSSALRSPAILALTGLRGPMERRSSRKDGNISGLVILFLAAESAAMMLQKWTLKCLETWQHCKMNPVHPSARVPGPTLGEAAIVSRKKEKRGPRDWMVNETRGAVQPVPNGCKHWAGRLAPASPGTGRVVVFFHPISSFGLHTRSRVSLSRREITSPRPALSTRLPELPLFSLLSSSHLSASTLAPAAHDQRHFTHFGHFTFFIT